MIGRFKHKGLKELLETGASSKVRPDLQARVLRRLDTLNGAKTLENVNIPGFNFHKLRGKPVRYSIHVNGPWCITFEWEPDGPTNVDLKQYH